MRLAVAGTLIGVKTHYLHILKALTQRYRNDEFEDRKKETFSYPKIYQSPKPDDIRMSHNALKTKMAEQGAADMKAKLNNKLVDPNAALKAKLTGKR